MWDVGVARISECMAWGVAQLNRIATRSKAGGAACQEEAQQAMGMDKRRRNRAWADDGAIGKEIVGGARGQGCYKGMHCGRVFQHAGTGKAVGCAVETIRLGLFGLLRQTIKGEACGVASQEGGAPATQLLRCSLQMRRKKRKTTKTHMGSSSMCWK